MSRETIHLIGGGLVGSLTAVYLAQRGFSVELYERRPDMRKATISAGRSINLVITSRGMKALGEVGLTEEALAIAIPCTGRMLHDREGKTSFVPYGQKAHEVIHSIARGDLNKLLLTKAESYPNVRIHFGQRCMAYDADRDQLIFYNEETKTEKTIDAQHVIGTDGSGSVLRKTLQEKLPNFVQTENTHAYGYKELAILPAEGGGFQMEKTALQLWPRGDFMLMALPNIDGSFTLTLFYAHKGPQSFEQLTTPAAVTAFFEENFADVVPLIPNLAEMFLANPIGNMVTVKCAPWNYQDKLLLIGDAAHAIVPFYGQGANCGFEDASAFAHHLGNNKDPDWAHIFNATAEERKPNADAIADMALANFIEMRATTADPKFQLKKEVGFELERRHPGQFIPRYSMVVFHPEIPYAEAYKRGLEQDKLLDELCANATSVGDINWRHATDHIAA